MDQKEPTAESSQESESTVVADPPSSSATLDALIAEGDHLLEEKNDLLDRLLRRQAEFDNFRRRAERERADTLEYANTETVRSILPILDDFERALKLEPRGKEYTRGME